MFWVVLACSSESPSADSGTVTDTALSGPLDIRVSAEEPPDGGFQIVTPEFTVPPHSDLMRCLSGTYNGPDVGVNFFQWFQNTDFGHHMMFLDGSMVDDFEDGAFVDCTDETSMKLRPLLAANELLGELSGRMVLADGLAVPLRSGQRWVSQSHYLNPSDDELLAQDVINIGVIPTAEVENWAGAWSFNHSGFSIPPGETYTLAFSCRWDRPVNVISMMGHMHDYGLSIEVRHVTPTSDEAIYSLPEWDPTWQNQPQLVSFADGELTPAVDDRFDVACTYLNTSDTALTFPTEMCVAAGLAWPLETPMQCDAAHAQ